MLQLRVLGSTDLRVGDGGELPAVLRQPKRTALLTYLAAACPRGFHRRDTLLALFWPEHDAAHARDALNSALRFLRREVGPDVLPSRGAEEVGLAPGQVWCDAVAFDAALREGRPQEALVLYRGDLLAGFHIAGAPEFERWLDGERARLRRGAADAAQALAEARERDGDAAAAASWGRRAMELAPADETAVRRLLLLLERLGDRGGALRAYDAFAAELRREYEVEPAAETRALATRLRAGHDAGAAAAPTLERRAAHSRAGRAVAVAAEHQGTPEPRAASPAPPAPSPPRAGRSLRRRGRSLRTAAFAAVVVATAGGVVALRPARGRPELDPRRVAVAAFENQTGDPALDPLGRMAADWLTQGLTQTRLLDVVPSSPTRYFSDRGNGRGAPAGTDRVRALAEATSAGTVVWGTYYRSGDSVRFQAQVTRVTRAGRDSLLRAPEPVAGSLERPADAVERLRQRVTGSLAASFDRRLAVLGRTTMEPPTYEAYHQFMLGIERLYRLENREATTHFARAAALDSTSGHSTHDQALLWAAVAYLDLGRTADADSAAAVLTARRDRLSDLDRHTLDWVVAMRRGDGTAELDAARRVHELTPGSDLSETMHGRAAERANRPREAVRALAAVDEQGPMGEWPAYWRSLTSAHHMVGDHRRELAVAARARERRPHLFTLVSEVRALAALGRVGQVRDRLEESLALPNDPAGTTPADVMERAALELRAHGHLTAAGAALDAAIRWYRARPADERAGEARRYGLARALYLASRTEECETLFGQLAAEKPDDPNYLGYRGVLAAGRGERQEAERVSAALASLQRPDLRGQHTLWRARIAALLGQKEHAVALLREAMHQGQQYGAFVHTIPQFEPLRGYAPFRELLRPKG